MKKFILAMVFVLTLFTNAYAKSGDIAGKIYSTDIQAVINGVPVSSYNIGGKTVVIVEDITNQYKYYNALRTLIIDDFAPEKLVNGENTNKVTGKVVGNIYETDIKTYYRGRYLNAYSLDGKMAVVVEELGGDNTYSEIGGKYIWNSEKRTISLETLYRYPYSMRNMLEDENYNIILTDGYGYLEAKPTPSPLNAGYILYDGEIAENSFLPVKFNGEVIGYKCSFADLWVDTDENGKIFSKEIQNPVEFFYVDKVEEMIFKAGVITPTADDWVNYFNNHTLSTIKDSYETDDYLFLYMFSSYVMNGSDRLVKINKADGTKIEYQNMLDNESYKRFSDVVIENNKVYFTYDKGYVINLLTDEIREYEKLETDMGIGSSEGVPDGYNLQAAATTGQTQYKINDDLLVNGINTPEFYYADMLPLKETFEFLNIKYSFVDDVLTIDTTDAKEFKYDVVSKNNFLYGDNSINYLYVEKVVLNGEETEITYQYTSGHFQNTHTGRDKAMPYVVDGKVYINASFIKLICEKGTE